ncbi:hypothetical protein ACFFRR_000290 [Megaselia abdita]
MMYPALLFLLLLFLHRSLLVRCETNLPPIFTQVMNNLVLSENTEVGEVIYRLEGYDQEGSIVTFGSIGSDHFQVDPVSGNVTLVKKLDREEKDTITFLVTIRDRVNGETESDQDNIVRVPINVIVLDENDNAPEFQDTPYESVVLENTTVGSTIFDRIVVTDRDRVGDNLDIFCLSEDDSCEKFKLKVMESSQDRLKGAVILNDNLDYNQQMIYYFQIRATDGNHSSFTNFEVHVKDVQSLPPVFHGSLSAVIDEDSPIGTLVLRVHARDGDTGEPRKIVYNLITNPMDYFLLDEKSGELRTARPLDKEALPDNTGLIKLLIQARELVNGVPGTDNSTSAQAEATITIRDVNDSPPEFNKKEYNVSLLENTVTGTPLALDMNVTDRDVGVNSKFSLRLEDVSGVFEIEPKFVTGSSQVNIRVGEGTLDYENPNQRKFIVLVIAEETDTNPKLSSTATITVSVLDANDNKPTFEEESFTASITEAAKPGQYITTITAKDADSGNYGEFGIRYSISGSGSELFNVNERTGVITLADCHKISKINSVEQNIRRKRQASEYEVFQSNFEIPTESLEERSTERSPNEQENCLDYEKETTYFLSYKATDDGGKGQTSMVSLRISVDDANDNPPVCESANYKASVDEGSTIFDSPLIIKARDADAVHDINYRLIGNDFIEGIFQIDKQSGQVTINRNASLDVSTLKTDHLTFSVEANDGVFSTSCKVNVTIRDVNNHVPKFLFDKYSAVIEETSEIGTKVEHLTAEDLDTGINAELRYRLQKGSFNDFKIDELTGEIFVSRKLDYDQRNTYEMEILASDLGTPSLSGTATLVVNVTNSNDKNPYFTPTNQKAEVKEDALVGTVVHTLVAIDPDVAAFDALEFAATEPISAVDKDGNEIQDVESLKGYFSVNRGGKVTINRKLDRNLFAVIRITVLVTDVTAPNVQQGRGRLDITIIDINEIPPKFYPPWTPENPTIKVQFVEEQPIGTTLITLQASDEDSTIGEYRISDNEFFNINQTTGVIKTKTRLDYEKTKEIQFIATVTDTGIPQLTSTAQIVVDILNTNDNEPHFSQTVYYFNITENSPRGTVVGKVEATDEDAGAYGEITYSLVGENHNYFMIDSYTGSIMISNSSVLDHELISEIVLTVVAKDKAPENIQRSTIATIYINVLDVNDNPPVFTQNEYFSTIAENAAINPPAALLQIKALDADSGIFGEVRYFIVEGNEDNLFKLDSNTGILYPAQNLKGKKGIYILQVQARDNQGSGTFEASATATITVLGVNQYQPFFVIPGVSNATVEITGDNIPANYLVMTVKATDEDTGDNGRISYFLQHENQNVDSTDDFSINEITGELRTLRDLNRFEKSSYELILTARDNGSPSPFESIRFLTVILLDANENRPEFPDSSNPYKFSIHENTGRNIKVGKIEATTRSKRNNDIFYYMLLGNEDGAFAIDKITGEIFTNKSLDRETTDFYTIYILASTNKELHISENERASFSIKSLDRDKNKAKILITVLDVNDNPPVFEKEIYYAGVNAKSSINGDVVVVNATDLDSGKNAKIEYFITASNLYKFGSSRSTGSILPSPFVINQNGRISTNTPMAEYNQDRFELEILAKEMEPPETTAKTTVFVWIYDTSQLIRIILSRKPDKVEHVKDMIVDELANVTQHRIIVDEIRYHVDAKARIRMDWSDMYFHAVNPETNQIAMVDDILRVIDSKYEVLKDYYADNAIENVVPAYITNVQEEFDLALAGLVALIIVLFIGVVSFIVLCCCLKHWNLSVPTESRRKEALIKKQIIEELNTTENPLWIEQKLKLYEEQELTMQVFAEPEQSSTSDGVPAPNERIPTLHPVDNTYATIQPRNIENRINDFADYATLRNNRAPSGQHSRRLFEKGTMPSQN